MDIYNAVNQMRLERKTIYDLKLRVTYYARVSTNKEEQDGSIEHQIEHFEEMIKKNPNWTYIEGYYDRIRGENAANRENFLQMIEDGMSGMFDLILTKEVSRFARNTIDSLTYTRDLLRNGVGVFFQNDNICTIDADSELRLTIMSSIAQDEVRKLSERIKFGHKKSIENGTVHGNSRIFGYDKNNGKLVINEKEAEMVKTIFELYSTGEYSSRQLEKVLWDKGYRNRNGNLIHHNTINGIIQNPKYKGYYCGNKVKIIDYRTKQQRFLPEEEWIMYKDDTGETVPQIVSEEIWNKANQYFRDRSDKVKSPYRSPKSTSPLSGMIICGEHEKAFWRTSYSERLHRDSPIYQWICSVKKKGKSSDCNTIAIYETELYEIILQVIRMLSGNIEKYIDTFIRIFEASNSNNSIMDRLKKLDALKDNLNNKKDKLLDLYTDDIITKAEFKRRNDSIQQEIDNIDDEIAAVKNTQSSNKVFIESINFLKDLLISNYDRIQREDIIDKSLVDEIAPLILDRIYVYGIDKNNMTLKVTLKIGVSEEFHYTKPIRSSGIMVKKMISELRIKYTREALRNHQSSDVNYNIELYI